VIYLLANGVGVVALLLIELVGEGCGRKLREGACTTRAEVCVLSTQWCRL